MNINAKIYTSVLLALGFCVLAVAFRDWHPLEGTRFACYFVLAVAASVLKVGMPRLAGSMAFNFLFVLIGIVDLSLPETLLIGCTSVLIEATWQPRGRPTPLQVFFSIGNMAIAIFCAHEAFHSPFLIAKGVASPVRLGLATTAFFIANTFPISAVASLSQRESLIRIWKDNYFWSFPYYVAGGLMAWIYGEVSLNFGWQAALMLLPVIYLLYRVYRLYLDRLETEKKHAEEFATLHLRTIEALALAIEAKDDTTHDHLKRVQVYAVEIGKKMGMDEEDLEALRAAALLHDIGKLAVPEYIISKPGKLTPEEFEKMKIHPVVGAEILEHVQFPYPVVPIVRSHHERWNGTGYPQGLLGPDIPLGARILSAVDALDALASDRQYRRALPLDEAMGRVETEAGRSFDPAVVKVLKENYVELERKAQAAGSTSIAKLSKRVQIAKGVAPAAGFETSRAQAGGLRAGEELSFRDSAALARQHIQVLFDVTSRPQQSLSLDESLSVLSVRLKRIIPFDAMAVYLVRDDKLTPEYVSGDNYRLFSSLRIPMGQGLSGWVAENHKSILNGNPTVESGYLNDPNVFSTLRSALAVPLIGSNGVIGVLSLYHDGRDAFSKEQLRILESIGAKLGRAIEQTGHHGEVKRSTGLDSLTRLPDGYACFAKLEEEITRCARLNLPLGVLVCSVAGLEQAHDLVGDVECNKVLINVAIAIKDSCRDFDYAARMWGNEFVLILPGLPPDAVKARMSKLMHISVVAGNERVNLQVGEALYPQDGSDADRLLAVADSRLSIAMMLPRDGIAGAASWVQ